MRRPWLLGVLALSSAAQADDWNNARRDPQRTAASTGRCNLDTATVRWSYYLGGSAGGGFTALDVNADGSNEVVYVTAGGRVIAKRPDDTVVWETVPLDVSRLVATRDLDGDGSPEFVLTGARGRVIALSSRDGSVSWQMPAGIIGEVGNVLLADLNGDGRDDVLVRECGCCTLTLPTPGVAFSFANGYRAVQELYRLSTERGNSCGTEGDTLGDIDGDGVPEFITRSNGIMVWNARTGASRPGVDAPMSGSMYPGTVFRLANLDADPALEVVALSDGYLQATGGGARRVSVYDFENGSLRLRWEDAARNPVNDRLAYDRELVGDLDGDNQSEVVYSLFDAATAGWTLFVRDALSGTVRARLNGLRVLASADVNGDGRREVLALTATNALGVYRLMAGSLVSVAQLPTQWFVRTAQLDDDPAEELVTFGFDPAIPEDQRRPQSLRGWKIEGSTARALGEFTAPMGVNVLDTRALAPVTRPFAQLGTITSDGYLLLLDRTLQSTIRFTGSQAAQPGLRVGGYYSGPSGIRETPVVGRAGAGRALVVRDSRPFLLRLDARMASATRPPPVAWQRPEMRAPLLADVNGDGTTDLVTVDGRDVVAIDPEAPTRELWRAIDAGGPRGSTVRFDLLPARRMGATGRDVYLSRIDPGGVWRPVALRGTDGALRWNDYTRVLSWGFFGHSVADLSGDGIDDFAAMTNSTMWVDGANGTAPPGDPARSNIGSVQRQDNGVFVAYGIPVVADFDGDNQPDLYAHGGYFADRLVQRDLAQPARLRTDHTTPHSESYGAVVRCGTTTAFVQGAVQSPDLWTVRPGLFPDSDRPLARVQLATGEVFPPGMIPMGRRTGFVGNVTAVADLDGRGTPAVLVGSTDGWLYALDPCTLRRIWSVDFGDAVGEPVVGDTDGDGVDEVLVTVADGYLYALGRVALPAPAAVRDADPGAPGGPDLEVVETLDTLAAEWDPVTGASGYLVSVRTEGGTALTNPPAVDVPGGATTRQVITGLPLRQGGRYVVTVRAYGPGGTGATAQSNGVTVRDTRAPWITLSASPTNLVAGVGTFVSAMILDPGGLARARVVVRRMGTTAALRTLLEARAGATSANFAAPWDGADEMGAPLPNGEYELFAQATDLAGNSADRSFAVQVVPALALDAGTDAGTDASADAGTDVSVDAVAVSTDLGASDDGGDTSRDSGTASRDAAEDRGLALADAAPQPEDATLSDVGDVPALADAADAARAAAPSPEGCACRAGTPPRAPSRLALLCALALGALRRRRRR